MAQTSSSRAKNRTVESPQQKAKKLQDDKPTLRKRVIIYALVIVVLFGLFYAYQIYQMAQVRASLDQQVASAKLSNQSDFGFLKITLDKVRESYPDADQYSNDPVFSTAPMSGRLEARVSGMINESEKEIDATHRRTPMLFLTNILMPGAQKSTDDHYREAIKAHVSDPEFVEFNAVKLKVDDLMAAVNYCRDIPTELTYGYTDPIPDAVTKSAREAVIRDAAKRHLCPEKG